MATKPLTSEAITLSEKKMDTTLDEIIKMSKTKPSNSKYKNQRASNKSLNVNQDRPFKVQRHLDSRSTLRQGFLVQRSNFWGNQLHVLAEAGRKAAVASFHSSPFDRIKGVNWNKPRPGGPLRRQSNAFSEGNSMKERHQQKQQLRQQQQQQQPRQLQQNPLPKLEMGQNQKPKTLDSLFANMKEWRMRASNHMNKGVASHDDAGLPWQPWLRGQFGKYRG